MTIFELVDKDMTEALKSGDKARLTVLRGLKSDLKYKLIDLAEKSLTDAQSIEVLSAAAKKRRDSIEMFRKGGREDLANQEEYELSIISSYLPKQLSEDELRRIVGEAVAQSGAASPKDMGKVMQVLMPHVKGRADGKLVSRLVSEMLAN